MERTSRRTLSIVLLVVLVAGAVTVAFVGGFGSAVLLSRYTTALQDWGFPDRALTGSPDVREDGTIGSGSTSAEQSDQFQVFWEAWDLIEQYFYGDVPELPQIVYTAIQGSLRSLDDDYTAFLEPSVAAIVEEDATGEFQGIGAFVDMNEDGRLVIVHPFDGSPAEDAGLLAGDLVLEVDGISTSGKTLYEIISLIRGPEESEVTLLVYRETVSEPFEIVVRRERIEIPIVESELRDDGIGYLRLNEFSATAADLTESGLRDLIDQGATAIVFDLRQNPGGWLDQAIDVSDIFLDKGTVAIERFSDGSEQRFDSSSGDIGEDIPLVVLIDRGSASASEIVAGALQDRERAVLIGEQTFGKGSVQRPFTLSDGSELRVTVARWFTPNNRAIHGEGLPADIEVPWPDEELGPDEDPQLERAVEYLLGGM